MILHPTKADMEAHRSAIDSEESRSISSGRPEAQPNPNQSGINEAQQAQEKKSAACFICYEGIPSVLIDPCCHCELCKECMNQLITQRQENCPICKTVGCSSIQKVTSFRVYETVSPYQIKISETYQLEV